MNSRDFNDASLRELDELSFSKFHWRMLVTTGSGFFTNAYDLFVIGVVTAILTPLWHLSIAQIGLLNGTALAAAALGAIVFGWLADKLGRKRIYGIEVLFLFFGAILSALSPNYICLVLSRLIIGFGIGGDYPASAVVTSEFANRKNRGFMLLLVFSMQAIGLIVGPILAAVLMLIHVPSIWLWRILLLVGAIPAAYVYHLRRGIDETPRFVLTQSSKVKKISSKVLNVRGYEQFLSGSLFKPQKLFSSKWLFYLIGTAGAWFFMDIAFYGNGVSSVLIMNAITPTSSLLVHTALSGLVFFFFAVPGYICSAFFIDKIGRKTLQILGFSVMLACYLIIGLAFRNGFIMWIFIMLFGFSFFFINFGPNTTTFLIPSEIFPTNIRARAHGVSAAVGKLGAFCGASLIPLALHHMSLLNTMLLIAGVALMGILATLLVPEMRGESLEITEKTD